MRYIELCSPAGSHPRDGERLQIPDDLHALRLPLIANSAIGDELTAHARIDVEVWVRWRVSPTTGLEQWIPEAQMDPMYRTRTRTR